MEFLSSPIDLNNSTDIYHILNTTVLNHPAPEDPNKFLCKVCSKPTLYCCSNCKEVFYCSPEHQTEHWKMHRYDCTYRAVQPPGSPSGLQGVLRDSSNYRKSSFRKERVMFRDTNPDTAAEKEKSKERKESSDRDSNFSGKKKGRKEKVLSDKELAILAKEKKEFMEYNQHVRTNKLQQVMKYYIKGDFKEAVIKGKRLFEIASEIFESEKKADVFQFLADGLLLAKCYLAAANIVRSREHLKRLWNVVNHYVSEKRLPYRDDNGKVMRLRVMYRSKGWQSFMNRELLSDKKKAEIMANINKISSLYSTFAALFHAVGDFNACEEAYAKYVKLIENNFGVDTFEASNCYFLVGTFYLENKYYLKANACFRRCLYIRKTKLETEEDESISDCYYNLGLIYKQRGKKMKAMEYLSDALKIRAKLVGELSLPVAQVLEIMGKIHVEEKDYKLGMKMLRSCLKIREKFLRDPNAADVVRVKLQLLDLISKVDEELEEKTMNTIRIKNLKEIQKLVIDKDLENEYRTISPEAYRTRESGDRSPGRKSYDQVTSPSRSSPSRSNRNSPASSAGLHSQAWNSNNNPGSRRSTPDTSPARTPKVITKSRFSTGSRSNSPLRYQESMNSDQFETGRFPFEYQRSRIGNTSAEKQIKAKWQQDEEGYFVPVEGSDGNFEDLSRPYVHVPYTANYMPSDDMYGIEGRPKALSLEHKRRDLPANNASIKPFDDSSVDFKITEDSVQSPVRVFEDAQPKTMNISKELKVRLSDNQIMMLNELKIRIRNKKRHSSEEWILRSEFFHGLTPEQMDIFLYDNQEMSLTQHRGY